MKKTVAACFALCLSFAPLACGEKTTDTGNKCVPGRALECFCAAEGRGVQICTESGAFGRCECPRERNDACAADNGGCAPEATCTSSQGSRTCACKQGYEGDGLACTDINECLTANGGCPPHSTCTNTPGSRSCACLVGYHDGGAGECVPTGTCSSGYRAGGAGACVPIGSGPKIMLVIDASGSMKASLDNSGPYCTALPNEPDGFWEPYDPASAVACKWNVLKKAFVDPTRGFLARTKDKALFGLTIFPNRAVPSETCATGALEVAVGVQPGDNIQTIIDRFHAVRPSGGTPTTTTLQAVSTDEAFMLETAGQDRIVLLLTDGQPNCNSANESKCEDCYSHPASCFGAGACYPSSTAQPIRQCEGPYGFPTIWSDCWDGEALVTQVKALRDRGVFTCVIGIGALTATGAAKDILNAAALEGGMAREGEIAFYQVDDAAGLIETLDALANSFN